MSNLFNLGTVKGNHYKNLALPVIRPEFYIIDRQYRVFTTNFTFDAGIIPVIAWTFDDSYEAPCLYRAYRDRDFSYVGIKNVGSYDKKAVDEILEKLYWHLVGLSKSKIYMEGDFFIDIVASMKVKAYGKENKPIRRVLGSSVPVLSLCIVDEHRLSLAEFKKLNGDFFTEAFCPQINLVIRNLLDQHYLSLLPEVFEGNFGACRREDILTSCENQFKYDLCLRIEFSG